MNFYQKWENVGFDDATFWNSYFEVSEESTRIFEDGNLDEIRDSIRIINSINIEKFIDKLKDFETRDAFLSSDIPQFSSIEDGTIGVVRILVKKGQQKSFLDLGKQFDNVTPNDTAWSKYGGEQGHLAINFRLANNKNGYIELTSLGKVFNELQSSEQHELIKRLCYRLPYFQFCIKKLLTNHYFDIEQSLLGVVSGSTIPRRKSSCKTVIKYMLENNGYDYLLELLK